MNAARRMLVVLLLAAGCGGEDASTFDRLENTTPLEPVDGPPVGQMVDAALPMDAGVVVAQLPDASTDAAVDGGTTAYSCPIAPPTSCPTPAPRYADVEPIFAQRCVTCHAGNWNGPWPLNSYTHVADWAEDIRADVIRCAMPPPEAGVPITLEERLAILTWLRCGMPR